MTLNAESFWLDLPVLGEWGEKTKTDGDRVTYLHFLLDDYPDSDISKTSPSLLILTERLAKLLGKECTGLTIHEGKFGASDYYKQRKRFRKIPKMRWAEVTGILHEDDFWSERRGRISISEKAKGLIETGPHEGVIFNAGPLPSEEELERRLMDEMKQKAKELEAILKKSREKN